MTPQNFFLLLKRHERRVKSEDRRAGMILAMIYNSERDREIDPAGKDWDDFFTEWKAEPEEQTEEEMFAVMQGFAKSREGAPST